jgi:hypothetical protein
MESSTISLASVGMTSSSGTLPRFRSKAASQQAAGSEQNRMSSSFASVSATPFLADIREQDSEQYGGRYCSTRSAVQQREVPDQWKMGMMCE